MKKYVISIIIALLIMGCLDYLGLDTKMGFVAWNVFGFCLGFVMPFIIEKIIKE